MRFLTFRTDGKTGLAVVNREGEVNGFLSGDKDYPGTLEALLERGGDALAQAGATLSRGKRFAIDRIELLPPLQKPPKVICIGLNYRAHAKEGGFPTPEYPAVFARFNSSLIGSGADLVRPQLSEQFDYEGELVVVIGRPGRHIPKASALEHVAGYSIFNDVSVRDYQVKGAQWTVGKNFDGTGAFGPYLVTADEVPAGGKGLHLQTRLNGAAVQTTPIDDMIFDVAELISLMSDAFTLEAGDVIVTGTPSGIGHARKPPLYMKAGDVCEVEIDGLGVLINPVRDEVL
jgi:acylpyruvate hydrolase